MGVALASIFHGREPVKPLDLRFSRKAMEAVEVNSDYVEALQDAMMKKFSENKLRLIDSYQRYRNYYDRKSSAKPLQLHSYCLLLNPKLTAQNQFASKSVQMWLPLYRVEKVLTDSNYIIRKVGTHFTQCVHRIRLKLFKPQDAIEDINPIQPQDFRPDPSRKMIKESQNFSTTIS